MWLSIIGYSVASLVHGDAEQAVFSAMLGYIVLQLGAIERRQREAKKATTKGSER